MRGTLLVVVVGVDCAFGASECRDVDEVSS